MRHATGSARRRRRVTGPDGTPSERRACLELILHHLPVALWSLASDGRIMLCEGRGLAPLGRSLGDLVGRSFFDVLGVDGATRSELTRLCATGESITGTWPIGGRWHEMHLVPLPGGSGGLRGVSLDVTERWLAGRAHQEAQSHLRRVLAHAPMILWAVDRDGRVTLAEGKGLEEIGLTPSTAIGVRMTELLDEQMWRLLQTVIDGASFEGETRTARPPLYFQTRGEPLLDPDGNPAGAIAVSVDITERKRAEAERDRMLDAARRALLGERAARRRATFLAQASRVLAGSLDYRTTLLSLVHLVVPELADGCIVHVTDPSGASESPVVAYREPSRELVLAEIASRIYAREDEWVRSRLRHGEPVFEPRFAEGELLRSCSDETREQMVNDLGIVSLILVQMRAGGRALGRLCVFTTQGRELEQDDAELAADLAVHAALAIDNARLYSEQTAAVQHRDEFLSVASHELRTPVTSIQLAIQALARREAPSAPGSQPSAVTSMLRTAERQSKRLAQLVENLLDVSRIATGQLTIRREPVDLAEIAREAAAGMAVEATQAGSPLEVDAPAPVIGSWDRVRLEQVVVNLLSNALKYGGARPVVVSVDAKDGTAQLRVTDHGIGIPRSAQQAIFDRFERAVSARHYGGFGLGLYIVKQIVMALGGTVSVESAEGAGSTFTVRLPQSAAAG